MSSPLIQAIDLAKDYAFGEGESLPVLHGLNFTIAAGEFVAIMGPSGSGKSTLMNILGCLDVPSAGHYLLDGNDTARLGADTLAELRNRLIGFVFQGFNLLPRKDVEDNVALPMLYAGVDRAERHRRALDLLNRVGLSERARHRPNQLSGGQQQRVAIARAVANRPRLILADEPTGNLDTHTADEIFALLRAFNRERGSACLIVTHDPRLAARCDREIELVDGCIVGIENTRDATHG